MMKRDFGISRNPNNPKPASVDEIGWRTVTDKGRFK